MKIDNDVFDVLKSCAVDEDENILFLPNRQLDRNLYVKVNKVIESIGGSWNRKSKGHVFDHNPSDDLDEIINTGEWTDKKKEYQFFKTPKNIVQKMISLIEIKRDDVVLEPSAGDGAILDEIPKDNAYVAIELMDENVKILEGKEYGVDKSDFLNWFNDGKIDVVLMNPPFSKHQDVKHILHAWNLLKNGGRLVSIVSESPFFREDRVSKEFRNWMDENEIRYVKLDSGTFKESGTMVSARIIYGVKN